MKVFMVTLPLIFVLTSFSIAEAQSSLEQAKIDTGVVQGSAEQGITAFKGIPFAAPPVGDLRWRPPQAAAKWTGVREATQYGSDCAQLRFLPMRLPSEPRQRRLPVSECLDACTQIR